MKSIKKLRYVVLFNLREGLDEALRLATEALVSVCWLDFYKKEDDPNGSLISSIKKESEEKSKQAKKILKKLEFSYRVFDSIFALKVSEEMVRKLLDAERLLANTTDKWLEWKK